LPFPVPDWQTDNIMRWNYSNALTLWHAGHSAANDFIKEREAGKQDSQAGERFENKYRYYLSVHEKPRVKDMLNVFEDLFEQTAKIKGLQ
jgi:hypothetical protein